MKLLFQTPVAHKYSTLIKTLFIPVLGEPTASETLPGKKKIITLCQ